MLRVELVAPHQLTSNQLDLWRDFQDKQPHLQSAFLTPDYTLAVAAERAGVEVAILRQQGALTGFLPFQRTSRNVGYPVGSRLTDTQAVICAPGTTWDAAQLIRGCGLRAWHFHALLAEQASFAPFFGDVADALYLDLSPGFSQYEKARREAGSQTLTRLARLARKAGREIGSVRLVPHTPDPEVFQTLLRWKSAQYQRTGEADVFAHAWVVALLERLLAHSRPDGCGATLTALYFGDTLAAAQLWLRHRRMLHSWFPAYNADLSKYSPGLMLLREYAMMAVQQGVTRIELGKANLEYKSAFANGAYPVAKGSLAVSPGARLVRFGWQTSRQLAKLSWLQAPRRVLGRLIRPMRVRLALR